MKECLRKKSIVFAAIVIALAAVSAGCSRPVGVSFTCERINMYVGQSRELSPYLAFTPFDGDDKRVSFASADDCIQIDGSVVTALCEGEATVTARSGGGSAKVAISVTARKNNDLALACDGTERCVSADGKVAPFVMTATPSEYAQNAEVNWTVDGEDMGTGRELSFAPERVGEYTVQATADNASASVTVKVYHPTEVTWSCVGIKEQTDGNYTPVKFTAAEKISSLNPRSVYRWYVNGVQRCDRADFTFTPSAAGEYTVTLDVNGVKRMIDGKDSATVSAGGVRAPLGRIEFDGNSVRAVWDDGGYIARATVFAPDGKRVDMDGSDAQYAYRFGAGSLDLTDIVAVCAQEPGTYTVELVADGKRRFTFAQLPISAREHIEQKVFMDGTFVDNAQDCFALVRDAYLTGKSKTEFWLDIGLDSAKEHIARAARFFGLTAEVTASGDLAVLSLGDFVNAPTEYTSVAQSTRMFATVPHIEYIKSDRRPSAYVLACDRKRGGVEVHSSEQLLHAVLGGEKPLPAAKSTAQKIYSSARGILLGIMGASYTDEDKAHAAYDWLQWAYTLASGVKQNSCARFLEGVFGSADIEGRGIGVTDEGFAKAYALMLGMEGVKTEIALSANGRYYNRVMLDGVWYNVDVYGGKVSSDKLGIGRISELCSHRGLFVTDAQLAALGVTPETSDAADGSLSVYLRKVNDFGRYFDCAITDGELSQSCVDDIIFHAFDNCVRGSVEVICAGSYEKYTVLSFGAEIRLDTAELDYDAATELITASLKRYASDRLGFSLGSGAASIYIVGNILHVVMTAPL